MYLLPYKQVEYNDDGLTALIFTSEGDMRQAINNLQSTHSGFGFVSGENVFKVCDQPHPVIVQSIIRACIKGDVNGAMEKLNKLWEQGYSAVDIVITIFRVTKTFDEYVQSLTGETMADSFHQTTRVYQAGVHQSMIKFRFVHDADLL